ncbi:hypothetical protein [Rhodoferax sp. GW822-FHT02A01]|uniref:hypothetical protein n=1 Tax=Rhodoferax sp. GW822-FHT02A01 TaxID=3141537 RepID=UPI00315D0861
MNPGVPIKKAALISNIGGPEVVTIGDLPVDVVHIRIETAGLNPLDVKMITVYLQQALPVTPP